MEDIEEQVVYVAPDVELSQEEIDAAEKYLIEVSNDARRFRQYINQDNQAIYPLEELATSIGHWYYLSGFLTDFQRVISDSLEASDEIGDIVLRMSGAVASYHSISEQMYLLFLNLFQITREIYKDQTIANSIAESATKLVKERGGRLPDYSTEQLEFDFSDCS